MARTSDFSREATTLNFYMKYFALLATHTLWAASGSQATTQHLTSVPCLCLQVGAPSQGKVGFKEGRTVQRGQVEFRAWDFPALQAVNIGVPRKPEKGIMPGSLLGTALSLLELAVSPLLPDPSTGYFPSLHTLHTQSQDPSQEGTWGCRTKGCVGEASPEGVGRVVRQEKGKAVLPPGEVAASGAP